MVDSDGRDTFWPQRWHQIVAEYNISFERKQNEMRAIFEDRFDQIRKENDDDVIRVRAVRDECAQRLCDLIDEQAEISETLHQHRTELERLNNEERALQSKDDSMASLIEKLLFDIRNGEVLLKKRAQAYETEIMQLDVKKAALRDEIRDLRGFVSMHKRLEGEGGTIIATVRRKTRR